ncbi:MAG: hypothetical protein JF888_13335 [Candidatus Dormibacteraeota bacterium]|uniref:Uncharacterized protein n=1 Tax=Candidatus Dormiibacter inghamiae TaxID=3127013 RepID=A0A934KLB7_9BACT|nr:hypothetical protein [Candidatus Dormibacteraeota bacterium]MBJ7606427.1 hypothetical protein [Candidatus Dormibacteraeota bacterium]
MEPPYERPPRAEAGWAQRHAVELYVRTYTTMLQSSGEIRIDSLQQAHLAMRSALHPLAADREMDMGAFLYAIRRLPATLARSRRVVLGQSRQGFEKTLGLDISDWERVQAPARRRSWYYDGGDTLAVLLASPSDVDDVVPVLVAFQIEWNKLHHLLSAEGVAVGAAREAAHVAAEDWSRLLEAWSDDVEENLARVVAEECHIILRLIGGSHVGYARTAARWWQPVRVVMSELDVAEAPVYFVSSNVHSLVNVLSGVAFQLEPEITEHARKVSPGLAAELDKLESGRVSASRANWLYFAARDLFDCHPDATYFRGRRIELEAEVGIRHVAAEATGIDSAVQIVRLASLQADRLDPRVGRIDAERLRQSRAAIVNIDYPLGLAAYHLLRQVAESMPWLLGVYVMGKAATLNADVGDILIPNAVHNEHSGNTYWLDNCFTAADVQPHLVFGSVLDNQRAVTVRGTFLQNLDYLEFYYRGRYTVVEMEAGPYLDACYEVTMPGRHPLQEQVNMSQPGFDLGIVHYASDTPYTQARTLGARGLSYHGMDATYAAAIAVARRILAQEGALQTADQA